MSSKSKSRRLSGNLFASWLGLPDEGQEGVQSQTPAEPDPNWLPQLQRRADRVRRWALEKDHEDLSERYAWMLLLAMELRKASRFHADQARASDRQKQRYRQLSQIAQHSMLKEGEDRRQKAISAADARHDKPGGSRERQARIRKAWASGKYTSRDVCAEQECAGIGMSFSAARKALRNTPDPN